jgi:hypothetical protein
VFSPLKKALKDCRSGSDNDVKAVVVQWFQQHPKEFFVKGSTSWHVNRIRAYRTIFNTLYSFTHSNPKWISFEQASEEARTFINVNFFSEKITQK